MGGREELIKTELGLERDSLGRRTELLAGGEGLDASLPGKKGDASFPVKKGEGVANVLGLSLGFKKGLAVDVIVWLEGEAEGMEEEAFTISLSLEGKVGVTAPGDASLTLGEGDEEKGPDPEPVPLSLPLEEGVATLVGLQLEEGEVGTLAILLEKGVTGAVRE